MSPRICSTRSFASCRVVRDGYAPRLPRDSHRPTISRVHQSAESRGRRDVSPPEPGCADLDDGGRVAGERRISSVARPDGRGAVQRELGRRRDIAELVRHRARADRAMASPAADPAGDEPPWHHDARAVLSGARLLHARAAVQLPRSSQERPERTCGSMCRGSAAEAGISIATTIDGCRSRRRRGGRYRRRRFRRTSRGASSRRGSTGSPRRLRCPSPAIATLAHTSLSMVAIIG